MNRFFTGVLAAVSSAVLASATLLGSSAEAANAHGIDLTQYVQPGNGFSGSTTPPPNQGTPKGTVTASVVAGTQVTTGSGNTAVTTYTPGAVTVTASTLSNLQNGDVLVDAAGNTVEICNQGSGTDSTTACPPPTSPGTGGTGNYLSYQTTITETGTWTVYPFGYGDQPTGNWKTPQYDTATGAYTAHLVANHITTPAEHSAGIYNDIPYCQFILANGTETPPVYPDAGDPDQDHFTVSMYAPLAPSDGTEELRAICPSNNGPPLMMQGNAGYVSIASLWLNMNSRNGMGSQLYEVNATTGSDSTTGRTAANQCSHTVPCASFYGALQACVHWGTQCSKGDLGGLTICAQDGATTYQISPSNSLTDYSGNTTTKRFVTYAGTCPDGVTTKATITGSSPTAGAAIKGIHFQNINLQNSTYLCKNSDQPYVWLDNVTYNGDPAPGENGAAYNGTIPVGSTNCGWRQVNDSSAMDAQNAWLAYTLVLRTTATNISGDAFSYDLTMGDIPGGWREGTFSFGADFYGLSSRYTYADASPCLTVTYGSTSDFPPGALISQGADATPGAFTSTTTIHANDGTGIFGCPVGTVEISVQPSTAANQQNISYGTYPTAGAPANSGAVGGGNTDGSASIYITPGTNTGTLNVVGSITGAINFQDIITNCTGCTARTTIISGSGSTYIVYPSQTVGTLGSPVAANFTSPAKVTDSIGTEYQHADFYQSASAQGVLFDNVNMGQPSSTYAVPNVAAQGVYLAGTGETESYSGILVQGSNFSTQNPVYDYKVLSWADITTNLVIKWSTIDGENNVTNTGQNHAFAARDVVIQSTKCTRQSGFYINSWPLFFFRKDSLGSTGGCQ